MTDAHSESLVIKEGRFARFESIEWWDQSLMKEARVLVVGAGALGNEVIKNLALLGVQNIAIVDMDQVEMSNLSRSVLFREEDAGKSKAECAARAASLLYPDATVTPLVGNVIADVGLGHFRWAQAVVGALDNREARVYVNSVCAQLGVPWIDGGIEVLNGIVRGFHPPETACYECTMGGVDWALLNKRRSCSLLARRAFDAGGTPTTPTTASVIGAIQAQEVVKIIHGMDALLGNGFVFEGLNHSSYRVSYPIKSDCEWHEALTEVEAVEVFCSETKLAEIADWARAKLGGLDAIDFAREVVDTLTCPDCGHTQRLLVSAETLSESQILCPECGKECSPSFLHSISPESELMEKTVSQAGLPRWDIVWARFGGESIGIEMAGDS